MKDDRIVPTKTLRAGYSMSEEMYQSQKMSSIDNNMQMKYEIAQKFARQIVEEDMIEIQSQMDAYSRSVQFEAQLVIADSGIHKIIIDQHYYEVEGIEFTHKDIQEAVRNWKPELFL